MNPRKNAVIAEGLLGRSGMCVFAWLPPYKNGLVIRYERTGCPYSGNVWDVGKSSRRERKNFVENVDLCYDTIEG